MLVYVGFIVYIRLSYYLWEEFVVYWTCLGY